MSHSKTSPSGPKKPYHKRSDVEKIRSQWAKLTGLHSREEWSSAIVRAATAAELSANYAIRAEFAAHSNFSTVFVDSQLRWANGLAGKMDHLLIPLSSGETYHQTIKNLKKISEQINNRRNAIAHQGVFSGENDSKAIIQKASDFVETLLNIYEPGFKLSAR